MKICIICGGRFSEYGNNPWPIKTLDDGRCCDVCDCTIVIPKRVEDMGFSKEFAKQVGEADYALRKIHP